MLFFDTMFFDPVGVNPLFVEDGVKKNNEVVMFLHRLKEDNANF